MATSVVAHQFDRGEHGSHCVTSSPMMMGLAVDQERLRVEAVCSADDGREAVGSVMAVLGEASHPPPSRRTIAGSRHA